MRILTILLVFLLCLPVYGQQVKSVRDFSGGMANGFSNAAMQDNTSLVLSNYDIVGGSLERRQGMGFLSADTGGAYIGSLFAYLQYGNKHLMVLRAGLDDVSDDTAALYSQGLMWYDPETQMIDSQWFDGLFANPAKDRTYLSATDYTHVFEKLFLCQSFDEPVYSVDSTSCAMRPLGPGQARTVVLNGGGNVNGIVRYRYLYVEHTFGDTSDLSVPTFATKVSNGKVYLYDMAAPTAGEGVDSIVIYRKKDHEPYYRWIGMIPYTQRWYLDTTTNSASGPHPTYSWGFNPRILTLTAPCAGIGDCDEAFPDLTAPGQIPDAMLDTLIDTSDYVGVDIMATDGSSNALCRILYYSFAFIDGLGRYSYLSPPSRISYACNAGRTGINSIFIDFAVVPSSNFRLYRGYYVDDPIDTGDIAKYNERFVYVGDDNVLMQSGDHYIDTVMADSCSDTLFALGDDFNSVRYDDSVLTFQPSIIEYHGNRLWAAGNPEYPDYLYYSAMGYPTTFASDYVIRVASQDGDAITGLLSIADVDYYDNALPADQMVIFKQNSVWAIAGFTFTDYRLSQLMNGVGLVAERGYCKNNNGVFFVGQDGLYQLGQQRPISEIIQETVDSAKPYISRSVLKAVGDEIWWSLPVDSSVNNRTLVWSMKPSPHWTSYSFAMRDAIAYDTTQDWTSWTTDRALILTEADSIFRWNYSETDTLDGGTLIQAAYQSKYFFDDPVREKILWIDLYGTGTVDTLRLVLCMNDGDQVDTLYVKPVFTDQDRDRVAVNKICENFSLRIEDYRGVGDYRITGYDIGYMVWDGGKK